MAIGSDAPIGEVFASWGAMTDMERAAWFEFMRTEWYPNLYAGYAVVAYPPGREPANGSD